MLLGSPQSNTRYRYCRHDQQIGGPILSNSRPVKILYSPVIVALGPSRNAVVTGIFEDEARIGDWVRGQVIQLTSACFCQTRKNVQLYITSKKIKKPLT